MATVVTLVFLQFVFVDQRNVLQQLEDLKIINEKQEELAAKLEKKAIQLLNFYIVFQGVILTAIAQGSSLTSDHWWVPFFLSIIAFFMDLPPLVHTINKCLRARVALEYNRSDQDRLRREIHRQHQQQQQQPPNDNPLPAVHQQQQPPNDDPHPTIDSVKIVRWYGLAFWTGILFIAFTAVVLAGCLTVLQKNGKGV